MRGGILASLHLREGLWLAPAREPRRYDSKLEERFARDFQRIAPDWKLIREPEAFQAGHRLIFPDFLLQHRLIPSKRKYVEIVGFWTPEYLRQKLESLKLARIDGLILCIDKNLNCSEESFPSQISAVFFEKSIDARAVAALL